MAQSADETSEPAKRTGPFPLPKLRLRPARPLPPPPPPARDACCAERPATAATIPPGSRRRAPHACRDHEDAAQHDAPAARPADPWRRNRRAHRRHGLPRPLLAREHAVGRARRRPRGGAGPGIGRDRVLSALGRRPHAGAACVDARRRHARPAAVNRAAQRCVARGQQAARRPSGSVQRGAARASRDRELPERSPLRHGRLSDLARPAGADHFTNFDNSRRTVSLRAMRSRRRS